MTDQSKTIGQLNILLAKTNEAIKGFNKAAEIVESPNMKKFFLEKADRRSVYAVEIETAIRTIGGTPAKDGKNLLGPIHRAWIDLKTAFADNDKNVLLEECKRGEEYSLADYQEILKNEDMPYSCLNVLRRQSEEITRNINSFEELKFVHNL